MSRIQPFHLILGNNLLQNITNYTVWFAVTFWAFLETRSVFVTGMLGGIYLVLTAMFAIWFGSLVDHHRKKPIMLASSAGSCLLYILSLIYYGFLPEAERIQIDGPGLWGFILIVMHGVICGNIRMIALPTLVSALIEEDKRDKANGLVGMVSGIGFLMTSGISGFLVAWDGIRGTLVLAIIFSALAFLHLLTVSIDDPETASALSGERKDVDLKGTVGVIKAVPGLMDAYGLSLMEVQQWGLLWAFASSAFIVSGIVIAKLGLGKNPVRTLLLVNLITWAVACVFTIQSSILLLALGCVIWMFFGPVAEAAEQTTLQKVVPYERQGRVFGFAQSVEQSAAPLTAFLIGPFTQFFAIPFMTDGKGTEMIGSWFGTGADRGMALVFATTGLLGVVLTMLALASRSYGLLSAAYAGDPEQSRDGR